MTPELPTLLDIKTVAVVDVLVSWSLGCVVLFAWLRIQNARPLSWWSAGFFLQGAGTASATVAGAMLAMGASLAWLAVVGFGWIMHFFAAALMLAGARQFEGRTPSFAAFCIISLGWTVLWLLPPGADPVNPLFRVAHTIIAGFALATAYEFWRGRNEHLVSRWPAVLLMLTLATEHLLYIPLTFAFPMAPPVNVFGSTWFGFSELVRLLLQIGLAFAVMALARERTEAMHRAAARTDPLTGLDNRRAFLEAAGARMRRRRIEGRPVAVLMFDLDHFKRVNDRFGHGFGDRVLCTFARTALSQLRVEDVIGRIGGEEFAAFLWDASPQETLAAADRVRIAFARSAEQLGEPLAGVTVSVGVALGADQDDDVGPLLERADTALYVAKARGRNRVELASAPPPRVTPFDPARRKAAAAPGAEPPATESPSLVPGQPVKQPIVSGK
jgi:diguanylate cyclase (GGDEF)-like protein